MDTTRTPPAAPLGAPLKSSNTKARAAAATAGQEKWERTVPQVSVIIPTVGDRPWLTEAVASALAQVDVDLEVIVVANRPGTTLVLPDDPRVRLVEEPLAGKAYAVNRGALVARGRWLALLDDDDRWEPGKLLAQLERLAQCPEAVGCYTQFHFVDEHGRQVQLGHAAPTTYLEVLAGRWVVLNSTLHLDRQLYFVLGGISPLALAAADVDLVAYRLHPGNLTRVTSYRTHWLGAFAIGCANLAAARLDGNRIAARAAVRGMLAMREHAAFMALAAAQRESSALPRYRHYWHALGLSPVAPLHRKIMQRATTSP